LIAVHADRAHASAAILGPPQLIAEWLGFLIDRIGLELPTDS
jgi:hypothetical protein